MSTTRRFPPTAKKLRQARSEGDVAKSRELTAAAALGTLLGVGPLLPEFLSQLPLLARQSFAIAEDFPTENMIVSLARSLWVVVFACGPLLLLAAAVVVLIEAAQVGLHLQTRLLVPKPSRLNFFEGLKRLFGVDAQRGFPARIALEVSKTVISLALLCGVLWITLSEAIALSKVTAMSAEELLIVCAHSGWRLAARCFAIVLVIGVVDLLLQRHQRRMRLMMDAEELKREFRENEGDPELRGMRKQLHQELLLQDVVHGVRKAKVLVVRKGSA